MFRTEMGEVEEKGQNERSNKNFKRNKPPKQAENTPTKRMLVKPPFSPDDRVTQVKTKGHDQDRHCPRNKCQGAGLELHHASN